MIVRLILIGLFVVSIPFWLPTSLGGDTSYHFVLTDSMKGTLDPGAFVVLRRSNSYGVGDVAGYQREAGNGERFTILHRIQRVLTDGRFVFKGDAVETTEEVEPEFITGRLVFALPSVGLIAGALRQAPVALGGLLAVFLLAGGIKLGTSKKKPAVEESEKKEQRGNMFLPAALVVLAALPFASASMAEVVPGGSAGPAAALLEQIPLFGFLIGIVVVTRLGEVAWATSPKGTMANSFIEINYIVVMVLAVTVFPLMDLLGSARSVLTF